MSGILAGISSISNYRDPSQKIKNNMEPENAFLKKEKRLQTTQLIGLLRLPGNVGDGSNSFRFSWIETFRHDHHSPCI